MAGIGFSLRKILSQSSITRAMAAYVVGGAIGGGPWLISVLGILMLAMMIPALPEYRQSLAQFEISVTYVIAGSLVLSGSAGNSFSRYVADQLFLNKPNYVVSNLNGIMLLITLVSGVFSYFFVLIFFPQQDILYRFLLMGSFVILSNIWIVISLLTALKNYQTILKIFILSYLVVVALGYLLRNHGLHGFMFSFLVGQLVLILSLIIALYREYPTNSMIDFHFMEKNSIYKLLIFSGLFFNLAIWVDKFLFWFNPSTSYAVIGPFRASWVYDIPIFLAYLCLLPGMAVFLLLIETDFSDFYGRFVNSILQGKSYAYIKLAGDQMIAYALNVIYSIVKIQAIVIIIIFQFGEKILIHLHISPLYYNVLYITVIGTSLQVVLLALIDILYYMDRRWDVFMLSLLFFVLNLVFTTISIYLGPFYYGFGFTCSLAVVCIIGMYLLSEEFTDLEYKAIMLRERTH